MLALSGVVDEAVSGGKPPAGKGVVGLLSWHGSYYWVCITFSKVRHSDSVTKPDYYYYYYHFYSNEHCKIQLERIQYSTIWYWTLVPGNLTERLRLLGRSCGKKIGAGWWLHGCLLAGRWNPLGTVGRLELANGYPGPCHQADDQLTSDIFIGLNGTVALFQVQLMSWKQYKTSIINI